MNPVFEALKFRHACKKFDPRKKIDQKDFNDILECALLSPTSFGMEAWKFIVVESDQAKKELRPACWDQPQITDSSHVIVILARPDIVDFKNDYVRQSFSRRNLPEDLTNAYIEKYKYHMETEVLPIMSYYAWCSKQCYIALANIMTAAASKKIDTCPIEGFEKKAVEKVLKLDTSKFEVAVVVALGFRAAEQPERRRFAKEDLVEYR